MASLQAPELFGCLLVLLATLVLLKKVLTLAPSKKRDGASSIPRPRGLPLIGNLHQIGPLAHNSLAALAAEHAAPLMLLRLGSVPTLVVSSAAAVRAVFQHNDRAMSGRPALYAATKYSYGLRNVSFAPPDSVFYRAARRACQSEILGAARVRGHRDAREKGVAALVVAVADAGPTPVNMTHMVVTTISRIVRRVAFGDEAEQSIEATAVLREAQSLLGGFWVADYLPWLGFVDTLRGARKRLERNFRELDAFYESIIEGHEDKPASASAAEEDFVDVLLRLHRDPDQRSTFGSRELIKGILVDMFVAGTDTSAATVQWTMTELVNHPGVMAKAQQEVRSVVGDEAAMVRESDLPRLSYLKMVIKESMRLHPPSPLLPREATEPCVVNGQEIAARTWVLVNLKAMGADASAWGPDVAQFRPERHGVADGLQDSFALVPFGFGQRSCPGVYFATAVVELLLANLLFSFDWRAPLGKLDVEEAIGLTVHRKNPLVLVATRV